ncbi:MAG: hypothetical protein AAFY45_23300 [Bacteroidota bacterium]
MLSNRFQNTLKSIGANPEQSIASWTELSSLYQEKGRAYHNLSHISYMLSLMDEHLPTEAKSVELELAIWYHDVIYDPLSKENELRSAELAKGRLSEISNLSIESIDRIFLLIMSTQGHLPRIEGAYRLENEWMLDLDLSILGSNKEAYLLYTKQIRREYHMYAQDDYRLGRSQILKTFLERKKIYFSDLFQELFEEKARDNLAKEIEKLSKK